MSCGVDLAQVGLGVMMWMSLGVGLSKFMRMHQTS